MLPYNPTAEIMEDRTMDQKQFSQIAGTVFAIVALLHLLRVALGWQVVIGEFSVPMWFSWIGVIVAATLSYFGLRSARG
jgi:hypothetical protein